MRSQQRSTTVAERLRLKSGELTAAERKLMAALFANYPVAGLGSITEFAREAAVSTPSVLRLAKKIGFAGFPSFQEQLRAELSAQLQNPIAKHDRWSADAPDTHILNRFAGAAIENLTGSLKLLDHRVFDSIVALLADRKRHIHVGGGRITGSLAAFVWRFEPDAASRPPRISCSAWAMNSISRMPPGPSLTCSASSRRAMPAMPAAASHARYSLSV